MDNEQERIGFFIEENSHSQLLITRGLERSTITSGP
jgi:hypothetical protein